ncbi:hypothetical protein [uncultured Tessaracoccus sp.]|uniref:hypothetical protein n=1 Tax=uncultured Tessaracoccus sp. TaxID=905023 RepID=UPI0025DDFCA2|nr:hypothetical protein [uncultured Tessaracoccus sp.]
MAMMMPQRTSKRSPQTPHGVVKPASSSGWDHSAITSIFCRCDCVETSGAPNIGGAGRTGSAPAVIGTISASVDNPASTAARFVIESSVAPATPRCAADDGRLTASLIDLEHVAPNDCK